MWELTLVKETLPTWLWPWALIVLLIGLVLASGLVADLISRALGPVINLATDFVDSFKTPTPFSVVLERKGLNYTLVALRAVRPEHEAYRDRLARLFAADCAERVLPLFEASHPTDQRPRRAIEVARLYAQGMATREQLDAAHAAAVTGSSARFAGDAAGDHAYIAALSAALGPVTQ